MRPISELSVYPQGSSQAPDALQEPSHYHDQAATVQQMQETISLPPGEPDFLNGSAPPLGASINPTSAADMTEIASMLERHDSAQLAALMGTPQHENTAPAFPSAPILFDPATPAASSPRRHHPYGALLSAVPDEMQDPSASSASQAGPLRNRRGHTAKALSINAATPYSSFASFQFQRAATASPATGPVDTQDQDNTQAATPALPSGGRPNSAEGLRTDTPERTLKVGDHAFKIPLASPVIQPQIQAHARVTSTGRPSHARKVPDNHVKVRGDAVRCRQLLKALPVACRSCPANTTVPFPSSRPHSSALGTPSYCSGATPVHPSSYPTLWASPTTSRSAGLSASYGRTFSRRSERFGRRRLRRRRRRTSCEWRTSCTTPQSRRDYFG